MEQDDLLRKTAEVFERLDVNYFVTGSMATIAFGIARYTNDIDVVADVPVEKVDQFCESFPAPEFYCSANAVRDAIARRRQFNILHPTSGLKVDVMIPGKTEFNESRMFRRKRIRPAADFEAWFSSPEDVIVKKLDFFREGGSEKHLRDIAGVLKVQADRIDETYIETWIAKLNLQPEWKLVKDQLNKPNRS